MLTISLTAAHPREGEVERLLSGWLEREDDWAFGFRRARERYGVASLQARTARRKLPEAPAPDLWKRRRQVLRLSVAAEIAAIEARGWIEQSIVDIRGRMGELDLDVERMTAELGKTDLAREYVSLVSGIDLRRKAKDVLKAYLARRLKARASLVERMEKDRQELSDVRPRFSSVPPKGPEGGGPTPGAVSGEGGFQQ